MVTLIHGDDVASSRNHLLQLKKSLKDKEQMWIDPSKLSDEEIIQKSQGQSLFSSDRVLFVENGMSKLELLLAGDADLVIWNEGQVTITAVKKLPKDAKIVEFKPPSLIFGYLDSLGPGSAARSLPALEKALESGTEEGLVFYMTLKRVRQLIGYLTNPQDARGAPWQLDRIKRQAQSFGLPKLLKLYQALLRIDWRIKTGRMQKNYIGSMEFLLSQI